MILLTFFCLTAAKLHYTTRRATADDSVEQITLSSLNSSVYGLRYYLMRLGNIVSAFNLDLNLRMKSLATEL